MGPRPFTKRASRRRPPGAQGSPPKLMYTHDSFQSPPEATCPSALPVLGPCPCLSQLACWLRPLGRGLWHFHPEGCLLTGCGRDLEERRLGSKAVFLQPLVIPHMHMLTSSVLRTRPRNVFILFPIFIFNILETSFYLNINMTFFWWSPMRSHVAGAWQWKGRWRGVREAVCSF